MKEYKVVTVSQLWGLKGLEERATLILNSHALEGWYLTNVQQGWSGFLFSTLYMVLEKEITAGSYPN